MQIWIFFLGSDPTPKRNRHVAVLLQEASTMYPPCQCYLSSVTIIYLLSNGMSPIKFNRTIKLHFRCGVCFHKKSIYFVLLHDIPFPAVPCMPEDDTKLVVKWPRSTSYMVVCAGAFFLPSHKFDIVGLKSRFSKNTTFKFNCNWLLAVYIENEKKCFTEWLKMKYFFLKPSYGRKSG